MASFTPAQHRQRAAGIGRALGDSIGNRESIILADPEVKVTRDAGYPGCWKVRQPATGNCFIYRTSDNKIVG